MLRKVFVASLHVPRAIKNTADPVNHRHITDFAPIFRLHECARARSAAFSFFAEASAGLFTFSTSQPRFGPNASVLSQKAVVCDQDGTRTFLKVRRSAETESLSCRLPGVKHENARAASSPLKEGSPSQKRPSSSRCAGCPIALLFTKERSGRLCPHSRSAPP